MRACVHTHTHTHTVESYTMPVQMQNEERNRDIPVCAGSWGPTIPKNPAVEHTAIFGSLSRRSGTHSSRWQLKTDGRGSQKASGAMCFSAGNELEFFLYSKQFFFATVSSPIKTSNDIWTKLSSSLKPKSEKHFVSFRKKVFCSKFSHHVVSWPIKTSLPFYHFQTLGFENGSSIKIQAFCFLQRILFC